VKVKLQYSHVKDKENNSLPAWRICYRPLCGSNLAIFYLLDVLNFFNAVKPMLKNIPSVFRSTNNVCSSY